MSFFTKLQASDTSAAMTGEDFEKVVAVEPAEPVTKRRKAPAIRAVAPPRIEMDDKTLGGRDLPADRLQIRVVFEDAKLIGDILAAIAQLGSQTPICFMPDGMRISILDETRVLFTIITIPAASLLGYEGVRASMTRIIVASSAFQTRKAQFTTDATLTLAFQALAAESAHLNMLLYPRSGAASDGVVTRIHVPLLAEETDAYDEPDMTGLYFTELTLTHARFTEILRCFQHSMGTLSFTVTQTSLDVAGRCDAQSGQTVQITFVDADDVEAALLARPFNCHRRTLRDSTTAEPANLVGFTLSILYLRRALALLAGSRLVRLALGRNYANGGDFVPARITGAFHNREGAEVYGVKIYAAPAIEADN